MGVVIESSVWEPNPLLYIFIFVSCFLSIFLFPYASNANKTSTLFYHGSSSSVSSSSSFLRFQRIFLLLYSFASVMEGIWSVFGEFELASNGVGKEKIIEALCAGYAAALFAGTLLGVISDLVGHKKLCFFYWVLHLFVAIWKTIVKRPSILVAIISHSLANMIFSFSFEAWMVVQHEKQRYRLDSSNDTFWLMTFFESACLIGSQMLVNRLLGNGAEKNFIYSSSAAIVLAVFCIVLLMKGWTSDAHTKSWKEYGVSFYAYIISDKRVWLLAWAHACLHFSTVVFWILWAPTVVADGREVNLGLIYPCIMGSRMLGSTAFPWLIGGPSPVRTEDFLAYAYILMGFTLSILAYDYQEIGILVGLFCLFHVCMGLTLPSLARLRRMYVPNDYRGGMISFSLAPANISILLFLVQRGYYHSMENATVIALAAIGLFSAALCMYVLKRWGKQPYQTWHKQ